jgi:hypothetical protein
MKTHPTLQIAIIRLVAEVDGLDHYGVIKHLTYRNQEANQYNNRYLIDLINDTQQEELIGTTSNNTLYATRAGIAAAKEPTR